MRRDADGAMERGRAPPARRGLRARAQRRPAAAAGEALPGAIFDGLELGMERTEVARTHAIRPTLTENGRRGRVWVTNRAGE